MKSLSKKRVLIIVACVIILLLFLFIGNFWLINTEKNHTKVEQEKEQFRKNGTLPQKQYSSENWLVRYVLIQKENEKIDKKIGAIETRIGGLQKQNNYFQQNIDAIKLYIIGEN